MASCITSCQSAPIVQFIHIACQFYTFGHWFSFTSGQIILLFPPSELLKYTLDDWAVWLASDSESYNYLKETSLCSFLFLVHCECPRVLLFFYLVIDLSWYLLSSGYFSRVNLFFTIALCCCEGLIFFWDACSCHHEPFLYLSLSTLALWGLTYFLVIGCSLKLNFRPVALAEWTDSARFY